MKNARLHVLDVQAELAEGHVSIDGNSGLIDRPVIESARQVAVDFAGDYYDQSELSVRALVTLFGATPSLAESKREMFVKGFADGVGRFVLADCRLNNRIDAEEEPISITQPITFTHYMFSQYLGFNQRLGQNGLTKDLLRRNPFSRHPTALYDKLLEEYGHELNEYIVRKTFRNLHSHPSEHLETVREAYYDISDVFPDAPAHILKTIAFRHPEKALDKAEEIFGAIDSLRVAFPDIATHVIEHVVFNSKNPTDKLRILQKRVERVVAAHPKMPIHVALELSLKHPKQILKVAKQLESAVEAVARQYPIVRRGRAYHIGSWYGADSLVVLIPGVVELAAEYGEQYDLSARKLCEIGLMNPTNAEACIQAYVEKVLKRPIFSNR